MAVHGKLKGNFRLVAMLRRRQYEGKERWSEMIHICEQYTESATLAATLCEPTQIPVFFDIETTGLSPRGSVIYLIGCYYPILENGTPSGLWEMQQWFSESPDEEVLILRKFLQFITPDMLLCHYNGTTFDLPFLSARMKLYELDGLPEAGQTLDYYHILGPLKNLFPLPGRRQKHMESLIMMDREDIYDGGTLIPMYTEYVGKVRFDTLRANELLDFLLCHNREDVLGLARISALTSIIDFRQGAFAVTDIVENADDIVCHLTPEVLLPCDISWKWEFPFGEHTAYATIHGTASSVEVCIPKISTTLYYYYENYRDYYYLPDEDICIYASLAEGIPSSQKVRCNRDTARLAVEGTFLPQPEAIITPIFSATRKDRVTFFRFEDLRKPDTKIHNYVCSIIKRAIFSL